MRGNSGAQGTMELEKSYHQRLVSRIIGEMLRLKFIGRDIRQMQYNDTVKKG